MKKNKLVSIIIPTRNSGIFLEDTLRSIMNQSYKNIETIVVDGRSTDNTLVVSKKYNCRILFYSPKVKKGAFDATHKRNYGVIKSKGDYVYYVDADMKLGKNIIKEAVSLCDKGYDGVILPEDSFGEGVWSKAKNLERRCYWGDETIEAPRFFKKIVWNKVGGLDENLASGRDDGDLYFKLLENGYKVGRTKSVVMHNEGKLTVKKLFLKKYMYGKDVLKYVSKRPKVGMISYSPFRLSYLKNWKLFISRPSDSLYFLIMKTIESAGGIAGIINSLIKR